MFIFKIHKKRMLPAGHSDKQHSFFIRSRYLFQHTTVSQSPLTGQNLTLPTAKAGGFLLLPLLHWQTPYGTAMSYTVSTSYIYTVPVCPTVQFLSLCRLHLQSFFQNIDTCIRIPVMNRMAFGTLPDTNAQIFYPWISVATTAAGLTARIHRWYSVNFISIPASFIFQHFKKFCPGNTRYRF